MDIEYFGTQVTSEDIAGGSFYLSNLLCHLKLCQVKPLLLQP